MFFQFGSASRSVRPSNTWFFAGLSSEFSDIQPTETDVVKTIAASGACAGAESVPGCKVFHVSEDYGPSGPAVVERTAETAIEDISTLKGEVLVFRYKGKIHAVDHVRIMLSLFQISPLQLLICFADTERNALMHRSPFLMHTCSTLKTLELFSALE